MAAPLRGGARARRITTWLRREGEDAARQLAARVTLSMLIEDPSKGARRSEVRTASRQRPAVCLRAVCASCSTIRTNLVTRQRDAALLRRESRGRWLDAACSRRRARGSSAIVRALLATHHHLLDEDARAQQQRAMAGGVGEGEGEGEVEGSVGMKMPTTGHSPRSSSRWREAPTRNTITRHATFCWSTTGVQEPLPRQVGTNVGRRQRRDGAAWIEKQPASAAIKRRKHVVWSAFEVD